MRDTPIVTAASALLPPPFFPTVLAENVWSLLTSPAFAPQFGHVHAMLFDDDAVALLISRYALINDNGERG